MCQTRSRLLIFHLSIFFAHKKFLFQKFLITSLRVIFGLGPPIPIKNLGYAYVLRYRKRLVFTDTGFVLLFDRLERFFSTVFCAIFADDVNRPTSLFLATNNKRTAKEEALPGAVQR